MAADPVSNVVQGYAYDGGWMTTVGIPARKIGSSSATSLPGDFSLGVGTFGYAFLTPACPTCYTLDFNFDTLTLTQGSNVYLSNPALTPPGPTMIAQAAPQPAGPHLYPAFPISDQGLFETALLCNGGATTDGFDFLAPLVAWVENGTAPGPVAATGRNFNAATYQVVGNYITGTFVNAPTTRIRPLCPFPQQVRFIGSTTVMNGVPVATNPADLATAANYACIQPPEGTPPLPPN